MTRYNFLIVDDDMLLREGVSALLAKEPFVDRLYEAATLDQFDASLRMHRIDFILLDFRLKDINGMELIDHVKTMGLAPKIIVLTGLESAEIVVNLLKAGVNGIVFKLDGYAAILAGIHGVMQSGAFFTDKIMKLIQQNVHRWESIPPVVLTATEKEILRAVADGLTTKETAARLRQPETTTETYRQRLLKKVGVANAAGLIAYAYRNGLL
jgi:DNA-binding NarL/FixJ family response regulator